MSQEDKSFLSMAGEFLVAGELQRRKVLASITFGASKRADVFALSSDSRRVARIEVKTTDKLKWPVGQRLLRAEDWNEATFWVLVYLPPANQAPEFYILPSREIGGIVREDHLKFAARYLKNHGKTFDGPGVPSITRKQVLIFKDKWDAITSYLDVSQVLSDSTLQTITQLFHILIREVVTPILETDKFDLPDVSQIEKSADTPVWLPVPGMYGGFNYQLEYRDDGPCLVVESWSRVIEGSGKRHELTLQGTKLVAEGFV